MSKLAPIALFVFNRPEHTRRTLEALIQNHHAQETELYVFSDGARDSRDVIAVAAVREVINDIKGFARCTVIERTENLGLAKSIISGISALFETHETVIVLEDDLVTSNQFITYMNDVLNFYEDDAKAFSVTAHTLPADYLEIPEDYIFDTYSSYRCSSWSWGTWKDRWEKVDWGMGYYRSFLQDAHAQSDFARGGQDLIKMLRLQFEGRIDSWAIRFCYSHYKNDMYCIYPTKTLVSNAGLDNSGVHSQPDQRFVHPTLDNNWRPQVFTPARNIDARISAGFKSAMEKSTPPTKRKKKSITEQLARKRKNLAKHLGWLPLPFARQEFSADVLFASAGQRNDDGARAARYLFSGVRAVRPGSKFLSLYRNKRDDGVVGLNKGSLKGKLAHYFERIDAAYSGRQGAPLFSRAVRPNPFRIRLDQFRPSLVHLHSTMAGLLDIEELRRLDCPIVWTLQDAWAFTGGCRYPRDCQNFADACGRCPQLGGDSLPDPSHESMLKKAAAYDGLDLTIVTPSAWLASLAGQSALFSGRKIEVIPNGLDTERFSPASQDEAKHQLGISEQGPVVLFTGNGGEPLIQALKELDFPCTLLTFGEKSGTFPSIPPHVRLYELGSLDDDGLAKAYAAADMFVCASQEGSFPMGVAEALACGRPCIAFAVGGLAEMITHGVNGWLASPGDPGTLAEGIRWLAIHPHPDSLRKAAREKALAEYQLDTVVEKYAALYATITRARKKRNRL